MRRFQRCIAGRLAASLLVLACGAASARASTITIVNADGAGEGFNDPTPAAPVGGNPGTTVGAQRLYVFQYAAGIWGGILASNIEIRVRAQFDPLPCNATSGVLGSAGAATYWRDFPNAPLSFHWYHSALANKLANSDLYTGDDINITFNSQTGQTGCLEGSGWYLGVDGNEGAKIELLPVVLHELGHGLGFSTTTSGSSGYYMSSFPSAYDHFLYDNTTGLHWDQMNATQRASSAVACSRLAWDGPHVVQNAPSILADKPLLRINTPAAIAGVCEVGAATFGASLGSAGVRGNVVLANDGVGTTSNACEALINGSAISGKIALIDRGGCPFITKVKNAQNAGAIAVIIADTIASCPPGAMTGTDASITIPSVRVTQADGNLIRANLGTGVNATAIRDPAIPAGADGGGRVLVYTPMAFAGGSSISHWDTSLSPDALMEPALNVGLSRDVDLTRWQFADIGWGNADEPTGTLLSLFEAEAGPQSITIRWRLASAQDGSSEWLERSDNASGPWTRLDVEIRRVGGLREATDLGVLSGRTYHYRVATEISGNLMTFGPIAAVAGPGSLEFALGRIGPSPTSGPAAIEFVVARESKVSLDVVDPQGRIVARLVSGTQHAGRHQVTWSGEARGGMAPAGLYFVHYAAGARSFSRKLVIGY